MDNYGQFTNDPNQKWGFAGYIALSVLEFLFCGVIWGILGFVFSMQANDAFKAGDFVTFNQKKRNAVIALAIGVAITAAIMLANVLLKPMIGTV